RGEGRIAPTDVGRGEDHGAEPAFGPQLGQGRARVGDGDETGAVASGALPEVAEEGERLQGRAGLRRDDECRPLDVDGGGHGLDGGRMGGVEDRDLRVGGGGADDVGEDVGGEAGAAHAADDDVEHTVVDEALGDG